MKKKILSLIIATILILPCFTLNVFATSASDMTSPDAEFKFTLSADYQTLTYTGTTYVRFDSSSTDWDYFEDHTDNNCDYIDNVDFIRYAIGTNKSIIEADVNYFDGSRFICSFIKEDLLPEHQNMVESSSKYIVNFTYPYYTKVPISANQLSSETKNFSKNELFSAYSYFVNVYSSDESFTVQKGRLVIIDNEYYYVDYKLNNITFSNEHDNDVSSYKGYKVVDNNLIAQLDKETGNKQDELIDLLFSGELFTGFGTLLLIAIFALIPLAALVLFIILSIRAKTPVYKKLFRAIYIISASELLMFIISVILLIISK